MPAIALDDEATRRAAHGNPVRAEGGWHLSGKGASHLFRLVDAAGRLQAVAEARPDGLLHPLVVLG